MAANKIYTVVKDGEELEKLKTLTAAKKLADTEGAEVYCDGKCVYLGAQGAPEGTAESAVESAAQSAAESAPETTVEDAVSREPGSGVKGAATEIPKEGAARYRLTSIMNVRKAPSLGAEKAGFLEKGTIVEVAALQNDWLHLADGTFILYGKGEYAEKI